MLDSTKPTNQVAVQDIPAYIREDRAEINSIVGAGNVGSTNLTVAAGATGLVIGTDLGTFGFEVVLIDAAGVITLATIRGGTEGQVKVFIFQDNNISILDGVENSGKFYLNHLPALSNFAAQENDVLAVVNVGGDGASVYGYWKELYRSLAVK